MSDDRMTRGEAIELLQHFGETFIVELIGAITGVPVGKARDRDADLGVDPSFVKARLAVRQALRQPLLSLGDPGYRIGDDRHAIPLGGDEPAEIPRTALEAIRNRRSRRAT